MREVQDLFDLRGFRTAGTRRRGVAEAPSFFPWQHERNARQRLPQENRARWAGGFVRRVARTPRDDGVKKDEKEPALSGIFGEGPFALLLTDPSKPPVREV